MPRSTRGEQTARAEEAVIVVRGAEFDHAANLRRGQAEAAEELQLLGEQADIAGSDGQREAPMRR